jgi:hypothetical protein
MAGEVADIDPRPHHQFWVCGENEIKLFRSHQPTEGKNISHGVVNEVHGDA